MQWPFHSIETHMHLLIQLDEQNALLIEIYNKILGVIYMC